MSGQSTQLQATLMAAQHPDVDPAERVALRELLHAHPDDRDLVTAVRAGVRAARETPWPEATS